MRKIPSPKFVCSGSRNCQMIPGVCSWCSYFRRLWDKSVKRSHGARPFCIMENFSSVILQKENMWKLGIRVCKAQSWCYYNFLTIKLRNLINITVVLFIVKCVTWFNPVGHSAISNYLLILTRSTLPSLLNQSWNQNEVALLIAHPFRCNSTNTKYSHIQQNCRNFCNAIQCNGVICYP